MSGPGGSRPRVVVVGGGVAGLAAAHRLTAVADVSLVEASDRLGGKLWALEVDGLPVEAGPDSFVVRKPWAVELCRELGLESELVVPSVSGAFVWTRRRLLPFPPRSAFGIPSRILDLIRWEGLSHRGRLRALADLYRPAGRPREDESLHALLSRRLGPEAARVLVEPLLAGLHAGDPALLSVAATFPELVEWERNHGSLMRGARAALKKAAAEPAHMFTTLWSGFVRLVDALAQAIGSERIRLATPVKAVRASHSGGFDVETQAGRLQADAVILATPAFETARIVAGANPQASAELEAIPYASTAVVILAYPEGTGHLLPRGTGFVVPIGEGPLTACTWVSRKWAREEYGDRAVIRCFVARAGAEEALDLSDEELVAVVRRQTEEAAALHASPAAARVVRWERSMPQYEVGHLDRIRRIERALAVTPGLHVTGAAYGGVGIADCVRHGREAADRIAARWNGGPHGEASVEADREAVSWPM